MTDGADRGQGAGAASRQTTDDPTGEAAIAALLEVGRCPRCQGALARADDALLCRACDLPLPLAGAVPCLFADLPDRLATWKAQVLAYYTGSQTLIENAQVAERMPGHLPVSIARLAATVAGIRHNAAVMDELLGWLPFARVGPAATPPTEGPLPPLLRHLSYLHRDWGWDPPGGASAENAEALETVLALLRGRAGRVLVLGAGAGRLAFDLHERARASLTLALDEDPVLALAARRITAGGTLDLAEAIGDALPDLRARRVLRRPAGAGDARRFVVALADASRPPVAPGAFDVVLTPWFIDQVTGPDGWDLRNVIGAVHRALAPGGVWVNYGPLVYRPEVSIEHRYSFEEVLALVDRGGFAVGATTRAVRPHLRAPSGPTGRTYEVFGFAAEKQDGTAAGAGTPPAWLVLSHLPVPAWVARARSGDHPDQARALALVDGRRSIDDIARALPPPPGVDASGRHDFVRLLLGRAAGHGR